MDASNLSEWNERSAGGLDDLRMKVEKIKAYGQRRKKTLLMMERDEEIGTIKKCTC